MDRFRAMQAFIRIVDGGSLSAAARALGVSLPAMVRTLSALEEHLGTRLLNRTTRRMSLTDAGQQYYERSRQILGELEDAELLVSSARRKPAGTLSLTAPVLYGKLKIVPVVAEYRRRFPEVAVRLLLLDRNVNLIEEGLDLAIRIGALADSSLVAVELARVRRVVCASPAYLRRRGVPKHPRELAKHACLSLSVVAPADQWHFREQGRELAVKLRPVFVSNSADAVIAMAEAGAGVGVALSYQVERQLAQRRLRLVLDEFSPPAVPVSALYPHGRLTAAKVREFLSLSAAALGERSAHGAI
ncbi:MAG TPA: LysR family transcriptional regulator [Burkholderiales bacterium]|jgi:DNA-binding transcriptional LysR family regulator